MGITTAAEADVYDNVKNTRVRFSAFLKYRLLTKDPLQQAMEFPTQKPAEVVPSGARINAGQHRFLHGTMSTPLPDAKTREPTPRAVPAVGRKPRGCDVDILPEPMADIPNSSTTQPCQFGLSRSPFIRRTIPLFYPPRLAQTLSHYQRAIYT